MFVLFDDLFACQKQKQIAIAQFIRLCEAVACAGCALSWINGPDSVMNICAWLLPGYSLVIPWLSVQC